MWISISFFHCPQCIPKGCKIFDLNGGYKFPDKVILVSQKSICNMVKWARYVDNSEVNIAA